MGLLPILTGSIYFEVFGGLIVSILFSSLILYLGYPTEGDLTTSILISVILVLLSLVFGFLGRRMMVHMRKNRGLWIDEEDKKRAIQNERLRAIYELTSTLSSTLSYKRVLDSALDMSAAALNPDPEQLVSDPLVGVVMLFNGGKLRIGSARRFTSADMRVTFDGAEAVGSLFELVLFVEQIRRLVDDVPGLGGFGSVQGGGKIIDAVFGVLDALDFF